MSAGRRCWRCSVADPIGYVVACRTLDGCWTMDSLGMWRTAADAEQERALSQAHGDIYGDGDTFAVAAVILVEVPGE
jgi:hypothetical protein